ncbi:Serine/threonine-protein kinase polo [Lucilia cuprina]|uniref:polo kinase n=1 Tax=Lucilia cuprina TaxID=7375 RepID=A0A0L0BQ61_LUCCU|nr:serine/threonine-protein kinase polo [Lucilia cuprina]KAI8123481.1 Serine/threonine-protein kinase polo [Lucilia cuprina]KNC22146.1 Serine/threonine-protein kinase polo [Lucilia cuprina]
MAAKLDDKSSDIPERLYDSTNNRTFKRMRFFGKGGFAKCYEIIDVVTNDVYAGKIVSKKLMMKHNQKEKMTQEITIHRSLNHANIVKFHGFFEDSANIYIVLELCKKRSMMELHKRRKTITEYECRYYIYQIIQGVKYLHDNRIIHRDLKLGNLFLNDMLHVKIGDFGLATRIEYEGERKKTLCGTPNYIAPEILTKKGHSYEVDIWSIGCVMYTLLVGQPPFETKTLKDTYSKIKKCDYRVPSYLRKSAADMVIAMLQSNPENRPTIGDLLHFEFLSSSPVPTFLPSSCLTMAPRLELNETIDHEAAHRKPLSELNGLKDDTRLESTFLKNNLHDAITASAQACRHNEDYRSDIQSLQQQITNLLNAKPRLLQGNLGDENTDPAAQPLFWISKWVDYSDKYGFGYQLCDEGIGVMFNDTTKLILLPNQINVHFIDKDGKESYMTTTDYSKALDKKMKLLSYFKRYMTEHLVKAGANNVNFESDQISRMPHLHSWFRTTCAVVMHLTNGTVQLNFSDHMKIILCPRMSAITYMDHEKNFRTYRFSTIIQHGCSKDLYQKIRYAHEKLSKMLEKMFF